MNGVVNIDDLRKLAKKRLPKIAYDFIEGGTDDEVALATNEQAFAAVSQIWPMSGRISEAQARATFAYLQPEGPSPIDFPSTFTNEFLPK